MALYSPAFLNGTGVTTTTTTPTYPDNTTGAITAQELRAGVESMFGMPISANSPISASYTLVYNDRGCTLESTATGAITITIPTVLTAGWVVGNALSLYVRAAGAVTVQGAGGVVLEGPPNCSFIMSGQGATITLRMRAADTWVWIGDWQ